MRNLRASVRHPRSPVRRELSYLRFPRPLVGGTHRAPHFPRSLVRVGTGVVFWGRQDGGLGGNLEPGRVLWGRGGSGSPQGFMFCFSLLPVYSCSRAVVFLTSLSLLFEGVRSGTRRRRGASAPAQAGGGIGPESRRAAPARAGGCGRGGGLARPPRRPNLRRVGSRAPRWKTAPERAPFQGCPAREPGSVRPAGCGVRDAEGE